MNDNKQLFLSKNYNESLKDEKKKLFFPHIHNS